MSHNDNRLPETTQYFLPRIHVVQVDGMRSALTCRQCEDAPCAKVCPTQALIFRHNMVFVLKEKCIGCKSCILTCPFGAVSVVTEQTQQGCTTGFSTHVHKCDLCHDNATGPACVKACPTQAIKLVDQTTLATWQANRQLQSLIAITNPALAADRYLCTNPHPVHALAKSPRLEAAKKNLQTRQETFDEIYLGFTKQQVSEQGNRCAACGEHSFCEWTCPLHNHIPQWIQLAKEGRILEAVELSHQQSSLPEVCGRVCPQDKLCEGSCTLKRLDLGSVTVGNIERYITDTAFAMGWKPDLSHVKPTKRRVAIIGAGPAGIGCADVLARNGIKAIVYDRHPEIGGMLTFGIPAFKLDKSILAHRRQIFTEMGIEFRLNTEIGKDIPFETLLNDYDAVFIGVGTYQSMGAGLKNEKSQGVYNALPFLIANTKHIMGLPELPDEPYINMAGKRVVVLGGGDTAMDCVRTSIRHQAATVTCAYRRDEANMPGSRKEVKNAKEEGVDFLFNVQPLEIILTQQGEVSGIRMIRTEMSGSDGARQGMQPIPGSEFLLQADAIILAFGFSAHAMPWLTNHGVKLDKRGCIIASRTQGVYCQTTNPQIFAGGDIVRGADLVVTAMSDGRQAAQGIVQYLNEELQFPLAP